MDQFGKVATCIAGKRTNWVSIRGRPTDDGMRRDLKVPLGTLRPQLKQIE